MALGREGISRVCTITLCDYNIGDLREIMQEISDLGIERMRVWEATGSGRGFAPLSGSLVSLFQHSAELASDLGYSYVVSYDPAYPGDGGVACPQLSNLYMHINSKGKLLFCGVVEEAPVIADVLKDSPQEILEKYLAFNKAVLGDRKPWCPAREFPENEEMSPLPLVVDRLSNSY